MKEATKGGARRKPGRPRTVFGPALNTRLDWQNTADEIERVADAADKPIAWVVNAVLEDWIKRGANLPARDRRHPPSRPGPARPTRAQEVQAMLLPTPGGSDPN